MKKHKLVTRVSALETKQIELLAEIGRLRREMVDMERLSHTDGLTNVGNGRAFSKAIKHGIGNYKQKGEKFVLVVADINDLKPINDKKGHEEGDRLIKEAADILVSTGRKTDSVFRIGGDEFAVILPNTSNGLPFKERLGKQCMSKNISMASGWSTLSHLPSLPLSQKEIAEYLFKLADSQMYDEKARIKAIKILGHNS